MFQIVVISAAALLILQMVTGMHAPGGHLQRQLECDAKLAGSRGNWWSLLALAAIAVARKGSEMVVFLYGIVASARSASLPPGVTAAATGFAAAGVLYWLLQLGARRFLWRLSFRVTEILLLFLAASLLMTALDRAVGIGLVPPLSRPLWDSSSLLDDIGGPGAFVAAMTGYRAKPELIVVLSYLLYWLAAALLLLPERKRPVRGAS